MVTINPINVVSNVSQTSVKESSVNTTFCGVKKDVPNNKKNNKQNNTLNNKLYNEQNTLDLGVKVGLAIAAAAGVGLALKSGKAAKQASESLASFTRKFDEAQKVSGETITKLQTELTAATKKFDDAQKVSGETITKLQSKLTDATTKFDEAQKVSGETITKLQTELTKKIENQIDGLRRSCLVRITRVKNSLQNNVKTVEEMQKQINEIIKVDAAMRQYEYFADLFDNPKATSVRFVDKKINGHKFNVAFNQLDGNKELSHFLELDDNNNIVNYAIRNDKTKKVRLFSIEDIEELKRVESNVYAVGDLGETKSSFSAIKDYVVNGKELSQEAIDSIRKSVLGNSNESPAVIENIFYQRLLPIFTDGDTSMGAQNPVKAKLTTMFEIIFK